MIEWGQRRERGVKDDSKVPDWDGNTLLNGRLQASVTWVYNIAVFLGGVLVTLKIKLCKQLPAPNIYLYR